MHTFYIDRTGSKVFLERPQINDVFIIDPVCSTLYSHPHAAAQEQYNWMWSWLGNSQPKTQDQTTAVTGKLLRLLLLCCLECQAFQY